jgi:glutamate/tyrosine decarboxylase-like PLP-dependent enzyme
MGLADDALQTLPVAADGGLCLEALAERLRSLQAEGRPCLAVVATAGTTVRGAIDPLLDVAKLCRDAEVWLHVDAAIGGVFALSSSHASLMDGMELADSITLNPQKLLGITKASSLLLLRDRTHLRQAFATGLPYMEAPKGMDHGGEIGLQGTRPAEILKLWLGLRQLGEAGIEATLSGALQRRTAFAAQLDPEKFTLLAGDLHLLAFHAKQGGVDAAGRWSEATRQMLLSHGYMLSRPFYGDRFCLKAVFGNPHTTAQHLSDLSGRLNGSLAPA